MITDPAYIAATIKYPITLRTYSWDCKGPSIMIVQAILTANRVIRISTAFEATSAAENNNTDQRVRLILTYSSVNLKHLG